MVERLGFTSLDYPHAMHQMCWPYPASNHKNDHKFNSKTLSVEKKRQL